MTELDIKHALQNYNKLKADIQKTYEKIEYIEAKQTKTGGSIIRMPESSNNNDQRKLGLIERKSKLEKDLDIYKYYISIADDFIRVLPEPYNRLVTNKYIDKVKSDQLVEVYAYSKWGIQKLINRLIERYIENT